MNPQKLESICLGFPGSGQDIKWETELCYTVADKIFAITTLNTSDFKCSFKCTAENFGELSARSGIIPAPYLARNAWVLVEDADALTDNEWENLLFASYELVKSKLSKKAQASLG